jgi:acyl carrier protein
MKREEILARVRSFVTDNFLYMRPDLELQDDTSLMGNGIVDSMGVMEVISFLDEEFGVVVADADVTEENIGSLRAITDYVLEHSPAAEHARQIA